MSSDDHKAALFDTLVNAVGDDFYFIHPEDGSIQVLKSQNAASFSLQQEGEGDYDYYMEQTILKRSTDSTPSDVIEKMRLKSVMKALERLNTYRVYYSVSDDSGKVHFMQAIFIRHNRDEILLVVRDANSLLRQMSKRVDSLQNALHESKVELDKRSAFLSLMNRNIRGPLYSIMGLTKIAQQEQPDHTAIESYLHKVSMSGAYMSETIDDILDLRRIAKHDIKLRPEQIKLRDFFDRIGQYQLPGMDERGFLFSTETDTVNDLLVSMDVHCMERICNKLLFCASTYTMKGGRILLRAKNLYQESDFAQIELSVESQGIVMEPERLKLLTQPSEYFIDRITGDLSPLDIALVILKSYVKAMNTEQLSVTSDPNHGTAISLTLRLALSRKQEGEANPSAEASIDLRGKRVLIVDDNEINLEISEKLLLSKGIDVVSATNGQEAVHRFVAEKGQFDVILMDVLMPVMDGLEATRQIRSTQEIPNAQTIPIIAMTVNGLSENYDESFRAGMNAHLLKPVNPERLYSVISKVLSKKSKS